MLYGKIDRFILIAILVVVIIAVVLIFLTRKENNEYHESQGDLMMAMAEKLRVSKTVNETDVQEVKKSKPTKPEPTEEEEDAIIAIADKICFNQQLTQEEKALQAKFPEETRKRLDQSRQITGNIINKFLEGSNDFEDFEKEYYEQFQEPIDNIINFKKSIDSIALKISQGITDFSAEEQQIQQKHPKQIQDALAEIKAEEEGAAVKSAGKNTSKDMRGANPPAAADNRLKIILQLFDDGIPKTVTTLSKLYSEKANIPLNKGNMSKIFSKMVESGQLMCQKFTDGKVYHGPPSWFENKKLKKHYKNNIA